MSWYSFVLALVVMLSVVPAPAQDDTDEFEGLPCVTQTDALAIHLSVYQARDAGGAQWGTYCTHVPRAGNAALVFDLLYQKMRAMQLAVRIVEVVPGAQPQPLLSVPAKTYRSGVVTVETNFAKPGQYRAIVEVEDSGRGGGQTGRTETMMFPLSIGQQSVSSFALLAPWLVVLVVATLGVIAYRYFGRAKSVGVLGIVLAASSAAAHGGVGIEVDPCVQRVGLYLIHFTAYQPQLHPTEEYCNAIPQAGKAILVFDLVDQALRDMPVSIRVLDGVDLQAPRTLLEIPPRTYANGVVNAEVNLSPPGYYYALIILQDQSQIVSFPLRVGLWSIPLLVALGALLLGAPVAYYVLGRSRGWPLVSAKTPAPPRLRVVGKAG